LYHNSKEADTVAVARESREFGPKVQWLATKVDALEKRLKELPKLKAAELQVTISALGVMAEHVHPLYWTDPRGPWLELARGFKALTSQTLREEFLHSRSSFQDTAMESSSPAMALISREALRISPIPEGRAVDSAVNAASGLSLCSAMFLPASLIPER
jgi:hypothetical protein